MNRTEELFTSCFPSSPRSAIRREKKRTSLFEARDVLTGQILPGKIHLALAVAGISVTHTPCTRISLPLYQLQHYFLGATLSLQEPWRG